MRNKIILLAGFLFAFCLGFGLRSILPNSIERGETGRVTGIGGIFFKCENPDLLRAWYKTHLGLNTNNYGAVFEWYQGADGTKKGFTQWSPFEDGTKYFEPSAKDFMINYRVNNLDALVDKLRKDDVRILDSVQVYNYGKFVHIMDVEGNKIELWEPNDLEYEKLGIQIGATTTK